MWTCLQRWKDPYMFCLTGRNVFSWVQIEKLYKTCGMRKITGLALQYTVDVAHDAFLSVWSCIQNCLLHMCVFYKILVITSSCFQFSKTSLLLIAKSIQKNSCIYIYHRRAGSSQTFQLSQQGSSIICDRIQNTCITTDCV